MGRLIDDPSAFPFTVTQGFLIAPEDAPDEVIDARHYRRAMAGLEKADAAFKRLFVAADYAVNQIGLNAGMGSEEAEELGLRALREVLDELRLWGEGGE